MRDSIVETLAQVFIQAECSPFSHLKYTFQEQKNKANPLQTQQMTDRDGKKSIIIRTK